MNDCSASMPGDFMCWGFRETPNAVCGIRAGTGGLKAKAVIASDRPYIRRYVDIGIKDNSNTHVLKIAVRRPRW